MAFTLPRMPAALPPDYEQFKLWWASAFLPWWQETVEAIEAQEARQDQAATDLAAVVADLAAAVADIATAQATAEAAQTDADAAALSNSWTSPGALLSAADVGADVTITISAHDRFYGDGTSNPGIGGGTITGQPFSTEVSVYYDDLTHADDSPTYLATIDPNDAAYNAAPGRHYVGTVMTPANGSGGTSSGSNRAPGYTGTNPFP